MRPGSHFCGWSSMNWNRSRHILSRRRNTFEVVSSSFSIRGLSLSHRSTSSLSSGPVSDMAVSVFPQMSSNSDRQSSSAWAACGNEGETALHAPEQYQQQR